MLKRCLDAAGADDPATDALSFLDLIESDRFLDRVGRMFSVRDLEGGDGLRGV